MKKSRKEKTRSSGNRFLITKEDGWKVDEEVSTFPAPPFPSSFVSRSYCLLGFFFSCRLNLSCLLLSTLMKGPSEGVDKEDKTRT